MNIIQKKKHIIHVLIMMIISSFLLVSIISYHKDDPCLNVQTESVPQNKCGYAGSYISDILIQSLGTASLLLPIYLIFIAYNIYKKDHKYIIYTKISTSVVSIILFSIYFAQYTNYSLYPEYGLLGKILLQKIQNTNIYIYVKNYFAFIILSCAIILFVFSTNFRLFYWLLYKFIQLKFLILKILKRFIIFCIKYTKSKQIENNNNYHKTKTKPKQHPTPAKRNINIHNIKPGMLPPIELLNADEKQKTQLKSKTELDDNAEKLLKVLSDFGVTGNILNIQQGPVVTSYEFEPSAGTKSSRVIGLSDDIARSLSALSTRISVIPGRNALAIELPNKERAFFSLRGLLETAEFKHSHALLPLVLGKDLGGNIFIADLAKMPHVLVAGTTGSGKSVAINAIILSLLYRYTSKDCKMIMIDPKMLELSIYDNIPHLLTPVVTDHKKAIIALRWAVKEMENRYRSMSHLGVRNIMNYNSKIEEAIKENKILSKKIQTGFDSESGKPLYTEVKIKLEKFPFLVIIVDEMADLMLVAGKDIEASIQRLAQMARAAGIHIIMATQRPSVDVITGVIKANFPSRISFKVTSKIDSRTILGEQGAEQLLGLGDMLFIGGANKIQRLHGPFVDDKEVARVTEFLTKNYKPEYITSVTELEDTDEEVNLHDNLNTPSSKDKNDLYNQALNIVQNDRKCSISYIQRKLRIGYNKSASLVEELEKNGVLSEPDRSGKREILLPE